MQPVEGVSEHCFIYFFPSTIILIVIFSQMLPKWKIPCLGRRRLYFVEFFPVRLLKYFLFLIHFFSYHVNETEVYLNYFETLMYNY